MATNQPTGRSRSISRELTLVLILVVAVVSLATVSINYYFSHRTSRAELEAKADEYLTYLQNSLGPVLWNLDEVTVHKLGSAFLKNENFGLIRITHPDGRVIFHQGRSLKIPMITRRGEVRHGPDLVGRVEIGIRVRPFLAEARKLAGANLVTIAVVLAVLGAITGWSVNRLLRRPLEILHQRTEELSSGRYDPSPPEFQHRELGLILTRINEMAQEVQGRETSLKEANRRLQAEILTREAAEGALALSEEQYRTLVETASTAIFTVVEGLIEYANQACLDLFEADSPEELIGTDYLELVHPADRAESESRIETILAEDRRAPSREFRVVTLKGRTIEVESVGSAFTRSGQTIIQGQIRDITLQKQAERDLVASEKRYRELFDSITDFILSHDLEGRFLTVNETAARSLGYSPGDIIGRPVTDFMPVQMHQAFYDEYLPGILARGSLSGVSVYLGSDGTPFTIEYRNRLVYQDGKPAYVSGSGRDITEKIKTRQEVRRLEEDLRHAQKMEALGVLAGGVAHDFNNILQVIGGYVQLIQLRAEREPTETEYLDQIISAADRASALVKRLLTFSRKVEPELKPVDLNRQVVRTMDILGRTLPKMVTLEHDLDPDLKPVWGDPNQIEQVLLNLGANGSDAMPDGGRLTIRTRSLKLGERGRPSPPGLKPGPYAELRVSDTGEGIGRENLDQIFDPFFTTKEVGRGTGLGLATVYGIVQGHGGAITCDSSPGRGTTFTTFWPLADREAGSAEPEPEPESAAGQGELILIVDDEPPIREIAREMLVQAGYRVRTAASGEEATDLYTAAPQDFDLVLMDLGMPGMGGRRALTRILDVNPGAKVVIASGYSAEDNVKATLAAGASAFIPKPYRLIEMQRTIRRVLKDK